MNDMRRAGPDDIKKKAFSDSVCVFDKLRRCAIAGSLISNGRGMKRAREDLRSSGVYVKNSFPTERMNGAFVMKVGCMLAHFLSMCIKRCLYFRRVPRRGGSGHREIIQLELCNASSIKSITISPCFFCDISCKAAFVFSIFMLYLFVVWVHILRYKKASPKTPSAIFQFGRPPGGQIYLYHPRYIIIYSVRPSINS